MKAMILGLLLAAGTYAYPLQAQPTPREYVCYRSGNALKIDGLIDEGPWQEAPWTAYFTDIEGPKKPPPYFATRAKMLWDDEYFYLAAEIQEPHLWATYAQRDMVIFHENDFEVFIDPDGDTHQYYELEINALGTIWDLMLVKPYRDGGPAVNAWDIAGLQSAIALKGTLNDGTDQDDGWTIELAFPWKILAECAPNGKKPKSGDQWRINFSRVQWRTKWLGGQYVKETDLGSGKPLPEHNWVWSPQGYINMHMPEHWGFVQFTDKRAGEGEIPFKRDPDEQVKNQLREIYYAQAAFRNAKGHYASTLEALSPFLKASLQITPTIEAGDNFYQITAPATSKKALWCIEEDGKISKLEQ